MEAHPIAPHAPGYARSHRRQNSLQPARCQRIIVSGRTTTSAERHANSRGQQRQAYPRRGIDPPRLHAPLDVQGELQAQEQRLCMQRLARLKRQGNPPDQFAGKSRDKWNQRSAPADHATLVKPNPTPSGPADRIFADHNVAKRF